MTAAPRPVGSAIVTDTGPSSTPEAGGSRLRADAQQNLQRVLAGARQAIAEIGLAASYHDIARMAGVGVGTVYRRFPDRADLLETVLLDILAELNRQAAAALQDTDPWNGFRSFFVLLGTRFSQNAGLSGSLDDNGGPHVAQARRDLLNQIEALTERAQSAGVLRADIGWSDVLVLTSSLPVQDRCIMDQVTTLDQVARCHQVVLDGLRIS
jgi:AcrR family transcriptional regulator